MNPQFDSLAAFAAMGGHGAYVWAVYGVAAVVMTWLVARPLQRRARTLAELRAAHRRREMC